jgi:hypothetical protein
MPESKDHSYAPREVLPPMLHAMIGLPADEVYEQLIEPSTAYPRKFACVPAATGCELPAGCTSNFLNLVELSN